MHQYHQLLQHVLDHGLKKSDRTGTGTTSVFGYQMRFDLQQGFPLVTTKRVHWKSVVEELLWFIRGESNVRSLQQAGVSIWDEWADADGNLGPVYGHQWRSWPDGQGGSIDQLAGIIHSLRHNPDSRRHIVSAWNVADVPRMALPPCHLLFQFYVGAGRLSCQMYQRSADLFLGVPFNIASYALLTHIVAHLCELEVGDFVHTLGDAHIYDNHREQVATQLSRTEFPLPTVRIAPELKRLQDLQASHIVLEGYQHHPAIRGAVAV